ncbi:VOC family protein [Actinoalloteichus hymeniacidonis]|uniref:Lactoylglutathione lyase family protein n=1 Tax=Actinoalloteichus hymeniacidonis TaxID=340345 RepID=A0AAC9HUE7_9PSEU|nr:VOC family protein [Actinoalloteichus hymeniacidonis]AOS65779.1 lactoylglutathione lyase family protein [Actinoalloteichus hymeniacidonis]MBB5906130.1 hypothetical protein [Actinoalloteichus hymeniacidonis]
MPMSKSGGTLLYASLPNGLPCWVDLVSTDPTAALDFYQQLFGWQYQRADVVTPDAGASGETPQASDDGPVDATGDYLLAMRDGIPVGGISTRPGAASCWVLHLAAHRLDETATAAARLGAQVVRRREQLGSLGERLVVRDSGLAEIAFLQAGHGWQFEVGRPGSLIWAELITNRVRYADHFYEGLFEYETRQFGRRDDLVVWYVGGDSVLARVRMLKDEFAPQTEPHWLVYFGVDPAVGVDETVAQARALGAEVRVDPFDSTYGRIAVLRDDAGARFGLIDPSDATQHETAAIYDPYDD